MGRHSILLRHFLKFGFSIDDGQVLLLRMTVVPFQQLDRELTFIYNVLHFGVLSPLAGSIDDGTCEDYFQQLYLLDGKSSFSY